MYERFVKNRIIEAMTDTPVVLLVGPRRAGKTTLVRQFSDENRGYHTLDDQTTLDIARFDPVGFVRGLDSAIVDEVQRVPELLLAIKKSVDDDYRPGRFLLTGSSNIMTLPRVADSLAGRLEVIRLLPLSQGERLGHRSGFLEAAFSGRLAPPLNPILGRQLMTLLLTGGFPEMIDRPTERRRRSWAASYLESVLSRDLHDIAELEKLTDLPRFVRVLAHHSAQLVNYSEAGSQIGVNHKSSQRYIRLLEQVFLVSTLEPWHTNALKRLVKTPKLHFLDTGLLASSRGLTVEGLNSRRTELGAILETFVYSEILKMMSWSDTRVTPFHFRDWEKNEVDIVLERDDGAILGVEVKASATVSPSDFSGLRKLADACEGRFAFGVLLHDSDTITPVASNLAAAPLSCLWSS